MRLGIPGVDQDPVAHVLGYEAAKALHNLRKRTLISRNDLAEVFTASHNLAKAE